MSDDFFDDEQELMDAERVQDSKGEPAGKNKGKVNDAAAKSRGRAANTASNAKSTAPVSAPATAPRREAPPFWMVLAIAAIALILGIVIGYLIGTSATLAELGNSSANTAQQVTEGTQSATGQLPEGHPDLNINEDGTATLAGSSSSAE